MFKRKVMGYKTARYIIAAVLAVIALSAAVPGMAQLAGQGTIFDVRKFGAVADGKTDNAVAIQKAINACSDAGGETVLFAQPGIYLTGPIEVRSNLELHIEAGTKILASPDPRVYSKSAFGENKGEGTMWISGEHLSNFSITGNGMIDGNGISFMGKEQNDAYELKPFDSALT